MEKQLIITTCSHLQLLLKAPISTYLINSVSITSQHNLSLLSKYVQFEHSNSSSHRNCACSNKEKLLALDVQDCAKAECCKVYAAIFCGSSHPIIYNKTLSITLKRPKDLIDKKVL